MKYWLCFLFLLALTACSQAQNASVPQAAAATPSAKYPAPIQALVAQGLTIKGPLPAPAGYQGYVADYGGRPVPLYLLPDGKHAMVGTLFDAAGKDLTAAPLDAASAPVLDEAMWKRLADAAWIAEGAKTPRRIVYEFTDTECPYCHKLWQAAQPMLEKNGVQVRHIMVAVIASQSPGRAAALLDSPDPMAMLHRHENAFGHSPIEPLAKIPAATAKRIEDNNALMQELDIMGTPGIVYKDAAGKIHVAVGMQSPERIKEIFGK
ncbi:MAG: thiol:disulfide interchange protein DsbG [Proteobacteria bacterium]|nr:thiol:disulfide interchange protein DsbG [Pseudomonadota bacterium]